MVLITLVIHNQFTMARRFSRLEKVRLLSNAATQYEAWDDARSTRQPNVGGGTARGRSKRITINPFGFDPGTGGVIVRVTDRANQILASGLGTHISSSVGADDRAYPGFSPAKVIVFQGTGNSTTETSKITSLRYLKRSGESYTHPFGASSSTEREIEALNAITTALVNANANRTVSYKPESQRKV